MSDGRSVPRASSSAASRSRSMIACSAEVASWSGGARATRSSRRRRLRLRAVRTSKAAIPSAQVRPSRSGSKSDARANSLSSASWAASSESGIGNWRATKTRSTGHSARYTGENADLSPAASLTMHWCSSARAAPSTRSPYQVRTLRAQRAPPRASTPCHGGRGKCGERGEQYECGGNPSLPSLHLFSPGAPKGASPEGIGARWVGRDS